MTIYDDLSNEDLRRVIAERLGWTYIGEDFGIRHQDSGLYGYPPGRVAVGNTEPVPNWSESVDAALGLEVPPIDEWSSSTFYLEGWEGKDNRKWRCVLPCKELDHWQAIGYADTPARAICLAWLSWKDAHG